VNHPGHVRRGDAAMYETMKRAFLKILPTVSPGLTEGGSSRTCGCPPYPRNCFRKEGRVGGQRPSSLIWVRPKNMYGKGASSKGMADTTRPAAPAPSKSERRFETN
jgi:hypothetical protein